MKKLSLILIGGGDRGSSYLKSLQIKPECFKLVAIAEPVKEKRDYIEKLPRQSGQIFRVVTRYAL